MIWVYETDQWTSTEVSKQKLTVEDLKRADHEVHGGSADSVRILFGGGHVYRKQVDETRKPELGTVWFKPDANGLLVLFKANYDSSD